MRLSHAKNLLFGCAGLFLLGTCLTGCSAGNSGKPAPTDVPALATLSPMPTSGLSATTAPTPTTAPSPTPTCTPAPTPTGTAGEICFSEANHFCSEDYLLELSIAGKKPGYITYTMDGTEPKASSTPYTEPILLSANDTHFPNGYSIRAKAFYDDGTVSDTYVHTYFVNTNIKDRYSTVLLSINGDPKELTELPNGILVGENYKERGESSEREVHIEAIAPDDTLLFSQFSGVRVFGGTSREHAIKSLKLFARKEYDPENGSFKFSLFQTPKADGDGIVKKYDKLVLRNGGDDFRLSFLRDELLERIAPTAGFAEAEGVIPALAYVNGKYYGFYWLHESYCNKFFQNKNGKTDGKYIVVEGSEKYKSVSGDEDEKKAASEFNKLYSRFAYSDLTDDTNFNALSLVLDVNNYLNYMSYNMYVANYDWPQGNYRAFRYYAAEGESYTMDGETDGRWRFLLHDMDCGLGCYQSTADAGAIRNDLEQVLGSPSKDRYAPLLAALLKRDDCKRYFINRMLYYMDGPLSYDNMCKVLDEMLAERDTELSYYLEYLDELSNTVSGTYTSPKTIETHLNRIRTYAKVRPDYLRSYIESFFHVDLSTWNRDE